jgi:hypothetical protein
LLAVVNDVVFNLSSMVVGCFDAVGLRAQSTDHQRTPATAALGGQAALVGEGRRTLSLAAGTAGAPAARSG